MREAEHGGELQSQVTDAASKVSLLKREVLFNETLVITLGKIAGLCHTFGLIEVSTQSDNFLDAVALLEKAENELGTLGVGSGTKVAGLLQAHTKDLRYHLVESPFSCWHALLHVDSTLSTISIRSQVMRRFQTEELVDLIEALFADSTHRRKAIGEIRRVSS